MIISEQWLKVWLDIDLTTQELADCLTMAGLEVSSIQPVAGAFEQIVVGQIQVVEPHPRSDKLFLYQVNVGDSECLTIVSSESSIPINSKLAIALDNALLPSGKRIKTVDMHGVSSQGMFVSADLLGLNYYLNSDALLILDDSALIGQDVWDYFALNDILVDIDITPNRGDCLSVLGIARELAVLLNKSFTGEPSAIVQPLIDSKQSVTIETQCQAKCSHYAGRIIKSISLQNKTPVWLCERLRRAGIRCLNPVVDVMNYVMLELGQPLHAFDLNKIQGNINVREASLGDTVNLLDGKSISLSVGTLVIADDAKVLALAGIMGGANSAVNETTQDIFIESAWFAPEVISSTQRTYGISSDSSYRFARGVDPELQIIALERATELLLSIVGGKPGEVIEIKIEDKLPKIAKPTLKKLQLRRVLGLLIEDKTVDSILRRLGFDPVENKLGWELTIPSYRFDIKQSIDVIEEIARVYGYNKIQSVPQEDLGSVDESLKQDSGLSLQVNNRLASLGYQEVITYSFIDEAKHNYIYPLSSALKLIHPLSQEQSVMRTSGLIGLLETIKYNQNRQVESMRFFEQGMRFVPSKKGLVQETYLAAIMVGKRTPELWTDKQNDIDFYDIKADLESVLQLIQPQIFSFEPKEYSMLHPGQSAVIKLNEKEIGYIGALHPKIQKFLGIKDLTFCFEVLFDIFKDKPMVFYQQLSKFPEIRRDVAMIIEQEVLADDVVEVVKQSAGELLRNTVVFDIYKGKGIPEHKKSIALALYLQHPMRTLVDEEINSVVTNVVRALEKKLRATMRE